MQALGELSLVWSTGGPPLGHHHWPPMARRELIERCTVEATAGAGPDARGGQRPDRRDALGDHAAAPAAVGGSQDSNELSGAAASPGEVEGPARVLRGLGDLDTVRPGEILVCTITSPAWAPIFSKIVATVTDIGGIMPTPRSCRASTRLPAVVGTGTATSRIKTGQRLRVNRSDGRVTILDEA